MKRIHPLIKATLVGAGLSFSMAAFAAGDYGTRSGSAYEGSTGASGAASSAERAQTRDSETGVGQTTGPQAGPTAGGARGGGSGTHDSATGRTGATGSTGAASRGVRPDASVRGTNPQGAAGAEAAQRRDSPTGTGQTTGPQVGPSPDGMRGGGSGSYSR